MKRLPFGILATATFTCLIAGGCTPARSDAPESYLEDSPRPKELRVVARAGHLVTDKLDLLIAVDNSASMGDKQEILSRSLFPLLARFEAPNCLDAKDPRLVLGQSHGGTCDAGTLEFPPVTDIHVGVISTSLGGAGSDQCDENAKNPLHPNLSAHNNDAGHLVARVGDSESRPTYVTEDNVLAWRSALAPIPPSREPALTDASELHRDIQELVAGVHDYGCGFEAQLESIYRFLIQPDPYAQISRPDYGDRAELQGIDATLLRQRKAFLRPDSVVAVILLTDENDSYVDPLAIGGQGWAFLSSQFPGNSATGTAPRPTAVCAVNPLDAHCTSCGFGKRLQDGTWDLSDPINNDPNCQTNHYYDAVDDDLNVRPISMKRRFGVDPQFPISRYINGLQGLTVPNRHGEHPTINGRPSADYEGINNCVNPLFASDLPVPSPGDDPAMSIDSSLCGLPVGFRHAEDVFFDVIGGIAPGLLASLPTSASAGPAVPHSLSQADWDAVIGHDPRNFEVKGIDPHMVESFVPRPGVPGPSAADDADPYVGRDWDTGLKDVEFACSFPLPSAPRNCALEANKNDCDCAPNSLVHPPLCSPSVRTNQIRGKAYPTIREFEVAKALGAQAQIASICPSQVIEIRPGDVSYGYRQELETFAGRVGARFRP